MSLPLTSLTQAVHAALKNHAGVNALVNEIYLHVPARAQAPYVVLGTATCRDISTLASFRYDCELNIQVTTRSREEGEGDAVLDALYDALNRAVIAPQGFTLFSFTVENAQHQKAADGKTVQANLLLRARLQNMQV